MNRRGLYNPGKVIDEDARQIKANYVTSSLPDAIVLTPDEGGKEWQIELRGNLAAMLGDRTKERVVGIRRPLFLGRYRHPGR